MDIVEKSENTCQVFIAIYVPSREIYSFIVLNINLTGYKNEGESKILTCHQNIIWGEIFQLRHFFPWRLSGDFPQVSMISSHFLLSLQYKKWREISLMKHWYQDCKKTDSSFNPPSIQTKI